MKIQEEHNIRQWAQDMADQKASGLKQKEWCKVHGINLHADCPGERMIFPESGILTSPQGHFRSGPIFHC